MENVKNFILNADGTIGDCEPAAETSSFSGSFEESQQQQQEFLPSIEVKQLVNTVDSFVHSVQVRETYRVLFYLFLVERTEQSISVVSKLCREFRHRGGLRGEGPAGEAGDCTIR